MRFSLILLVFLFKVPFIAVTFCPDLLTHNEYFDYNLITNALVNNEIAIENVTLDE